VWVDFNSGVLHTPKGEVKTHDLIINDVTSRGGTESFFYPHCSLAIIFVV